MLYRKLIAVLILMASCSVAQDITKANSLLMKSNSHLLVWAIPPAPLHASGRFKVYKLQHGDDSAIFEGDFLDPRHHRTKYEMTGFQTIFVRNDGQGAERQNTDFSPLRIRQIQRFAMPPAPYFESSDVIKKIHSEEIDGRTAQCIDFQTIRGQQRDVPMQQICITQNPEMTVLRSDGRFEAKWSDFEQFQGKYYPRHMVLKDNGEKVIEGELSVTAAPGLSAATFAIPPGFDVRKTCVVRVPPVMVKGEEPTLPAGVRGGLGITENVVAELKLGVDGRVQKAALVELAEPALDREVQRVVPTWQFEPAKCDGEPVPTDFDFQVTFHR